MSGESLREMIERAGSGCTMVASGGNSSSRLPQPSSTASERVDSKRPSGFETAPRPVRALGRVGEVMRRDGTGYKTSSPAGDSRAERSGLGARYWRGRRRRVVLDQ